jgi:hypothetical protein
LAACDDGMFEFLMELACKLEYIIILVARRANDTWESDHSNMELRMLPTVYDSPKRADRNTLTY